ncbi:MAG TPA: ribonuclease HII [Thermoanaerobaculia bacterium]|nr:ribonuclease HII [Thermoanaerobaculia bacterium]
MPAIGWICGELYRLGLLRELEQTLGRAGIAPIAGVDEAGRGGLAGPVVAAAVIPSDGPPLPGVDDSKQLEPEERRRLAAEIRATARAWAVGVVSAAAIDAGNILRATRLAMLRAVAALDPRPAFLLVDAVPLPESGLPCLALVKGDSLVYAVACASILAKDERDRRMVELDRVYPHYGFVRHKGYAVPEHIAALERFGPSPEHRLTFASVVPREECA